MKKSAESHVLNNFNLAFITMKVGLMIINVTSTKLVLLPENLIWNFILKIGYPI